VFDCGKPFLEEGSRADVELTTGEETNDTVLMLAANAEGDWFFGYRHNAPSLTGSAKGAVTGRAKGIVMERHAVDEREAFNMVRTEARRTGRKLTDAADAILGSHRLLPSEQLRQSPPDPGAKPSDG